MTQDSDPLTRELPALRRFALALTRNSAEAEDLVQDALLRGHENRRSLRAGGSVKSWLFSILKNSFLDRRRSTRARENREAALAGLTPLSIEAPQDTVVRLSQLRAAFMTLPDDQREALSLIALEGLSYTEAARVAGIPSGTLMSRVARARAALRAFEAGEPATAPTPPLRLAGGRDAEC